MRLITAFAAFVVASGAWQGPKEPVWVPQAPPFGAIAVLAGFPDLRATFPMAGPLVTDVRIAEWSPMSFFPSRLLRLTDSDGTVNATMYLWWVQHLGPYEPPASPAIQCTKPREGAPVCILPISLNREREWRSVLNRALTADVCRLQRPTDMYELRAQVFERIPYPKYRDSEVCDPVASEFRDLFDSLAPNQFRQKR